MEQDFRTIPEIDIAPLMSDGAGHAGDVCAHIHDACCRVGFFYVSNHGIPTELLNEIRIAARRFFDLPQQKKEAVHIAKTRHFRGFTPLGGETTNGRPDWHECFDMSVELPPEHPHVLAGKPLHGPNQWPDLDGFRPVVENFWDHMTRLGRVLVGAMEQGLGLEQGRLSQHFQQPHSLLRMLHYPPRADEKGPDWIGIGEHTDYGCLVLLVQDHVGGLEARNMSGEWVAAPPISHSVLVNLGDMLEVWTNGRYRATPHRVLHHSNQRRYSVPFFFDPGFDTMITPFDNPGAEPIHYGSYLVKVFDRSFQL